MWSCFEFPYPIWQPNELSAIFKRIFPKDEL